MDQELRIVRDYMYYLLYEAYSGLSTRPRAMKRGTNTVQIGFHDADTACRFRFGLAHLLKNAAATAEEVVNAYASAPDDVKKVCIRRVVDDFAYSRLSELQRCGFGSGHGYSQSEEVSEHRQDTQVVPRGRRRSLGRVLRSYRALFCLVLVSLHGAHLRLRLSPSLAVSRRLSPSLVRASTGASESFPLWSIGVSWSRICLRQPSPRPRTALACRYRLFS